VKPAEELMERGQYRQDREGDACGKSGKGEKRWEIRVESDNRGDIWDRGILNQRIY
jgi:hypothetical protein